MKTRLRKLIRQHNWQVVEVSRTNMYKLFESTNGDWGDFEHYKEVRSWCAKTFPKGSWEASLGKNGKKFVFKEDKYAMLFKLKWS
jgi:hypothetical protein